MSAHAAIEQLVRAHSGRLRALCCRLVGDPALAEDVVQNAFIQAFLGWSTFEHRSDPLHWLRRIAVRCAIATLRERGRWQTEEATEHTLALDVGQWPCALQEREVFLKATQQALAGLTDRERLAFVLRHVEQFEIEDVAEQLGCSVNNCRQTVFRGLQKIRHHLAEWRSPT